MRSRTLAEQMAIEVLKGDMVAACALADKLTEMREEPRSAMERAAALAGAPRQESFVVWQWPEFRALMRRLGVLIDLNTIELTIHLPADDLVRVEQTYAATDQGPGEGQEATE